MSVEGARSAPSLAVVPWRGRLARSAGIWPAGLALVTIALVLASDLIGFGASGFQDSWLDASWSGSWSHVAVHAAIGAAAATCIYAALRGRRRRLAWTVLAAVLCFLLIDEISSLHVRIDALSAGKLLYAPLLLIGLASCVRLAAETKTMWYLVLTTGLLAVSYAIHLLGLDVVRAFGWSAHSWAYQVKVGLKEGTELAGATLAVYGLLAAVRSG
jgi:hypothetical protein